jgi:hypothetical protein
MSRSPAVAAGALAIVGDLPEGDALAQLVRAGPADVSGGLWRAVCDAVALHRVGERVRRDLA